MALNCKADLNTFVYAVGQTPPPQVTITVYNTGAASVTVTGIQVSAHVVGSTQEALPISFPLPPTGPGMTVTVPTLSSITFGPFPVTLGSAANVNPFQMVNQSGNLNPINPQPSQPPNYTVAIGGIVYGSDFSVNVIDPAALNVSHGFPPPAGFQGGFLNFAGPNNFLGVIPGWP